MEEQTIISLESFNIYLESEKANFALGFFRGKDGVPKNPEHRQNEAYQDGYDYGSLIDDSCSQNAEDYFNEWFNHRTDGISK